MTTPAIVLIATTWLAGLGPQIHSQHFGTLASCRAVAAVMTSAVQQQALSNMNGPHRELRSEQTSGPDGLVLRTPVGREVARIVCVVAAAAGSAALAPTPEPAQR